MFFFLKQVRILPEIYWYNYQSANPAPTAIVWHRIKTDPFWWSVTSEPTVPPLHNFIEEGGVWVNFVITQTQPQLNSTSLPLLVIERYYSTIRVRPLPLLDSIGRIWYFPYSLCWVFVGHPVKIGLINLQSLNKVIDNNLK